MTMQERYLALTEKRKIPEVIVVEGKDDTANLRRFYEVDTYETRGSAIDQDDLERIATLQELRGVIVFTDPDYNGERIRKIIMQEVPQEYLGEALRIGYCNGKQLLKRLELFGICLAQVEEAMASY